MTRLDKSLVSDLSTRFPSYWRNSLSQRQWSGCQSTRNVGKVFKKALQIEMLHTSTAVTPIIEVSLPKLPTLLMLFNLSLKQLAFDNSRFLPTNYASETGKQIS